MRTPNIAKNEMLGRPEDSIVYKATVPRLTIRLEHVLKTFVPHQDNVDKLYHDLLLNLGNSSIRVAEDAYRLGASQVEMPIDKAKLTALKNNAMGTAILAAHQVTNTTAKALGLKYSFNAGMAVSKLSTKLRSGNISKHQMDMNFFRGLRYGWSLNKISRKRSFVSSDHDKDDICDENEDAGAIDIDDTFPSGDFETPFHFRCRCSFILVR
jgi:hypothetical protein